MNLTEYRHPTWDILDSTKVSNYMECPRKFFFSHVLGWVPDQPSPYLHVGIAWHKAMEVFTKKGASMAVAAEAYTEYMKEYRKAFNSDQDDTLGARQPVNIQQALEEYAKVYANDYLETLDGNIEVPGYVPIGPNPNQCLYMRLDWIVRDKNSGKVCWVDHKTTTSDKPNYRAQFALRFQFGTYTHALYSYFDPNEVFGGFANVVVLRYAKTGRGKGNDFFRVPVQRSSDQQLAWLQEANQYLADIEYNMDWLGNEDTPEKTVMWSFKRNTTSCTNYNSLCPYHALCVGCTNPTQLMDRHGPKGCPLGFTQRFFDPRNHEAANIGEPD